MHPDGFSFKKLLRHALKAVFPAVFLAFSLISQVPAAHAANSVPKVLNYQARLTDSGGVQVPNGALNVKFVFYDGAGNCLYTVKGTCGTPTAKSVTVTGGVFSTLLGNAADSDNEIPDGLFDNNVVLLGITIGADSEMTPRKRISAAPYALNADRLDDLDVTSSGSTTAYIPSTTVNGNLTITGDPQGSGIADGSMYINPAAASSNETLFGIASNGSVRFQIDKEGDITQTGSLLATAASSTAQFIFRGVASQNTDIFEVQDSSTNRLLTVSATGVAVMTSSPSAIFDIRQASGNTNRLFWAGPAYSTFSADVRTSYLDITNSVIGFHNNLEAGSGVYNGLAIVAENNVTTDTIGFQAFEAHAISSHASGNKSVLGSAFFQSYHTGAGTITSLTDVAIYPQSKAGSGTISEAIGLYVSPNLDGTTTNLYRLRLAEGSSVGVTTNSYGLYIDEMIGNGDVLNYPIFVDNRYSKFVLESEGNLGVGTAFPANRLTVGTATSTFEVNAAGNLVKVNNVIYSWPSSQGGASTVLQNNGSGTLTWASVSSSANLNQAYLSSTSSAEISLTPSVGAVTIADTFSGTGSIFEIQDRTNAAGDYSTRYFTVSSTSTLAYKRLEAAVHANGQGLKLPTNAGVPAGVTGTTEGDIVWNSTGDHLYVYNGASFTQIDGGGATPAMNQTYLAATSTTEISVNSTQGALTIADQVTGGSGHGDGIGNLFEVQDRVNTSGDWSRKYFTVSATAVAINQNTPAATLDIAHLNDLAGTALRITTGGNTIFSVDFQGTIYGDRQFVLSRSAIIAQQADQFWSSPALSISPFADFTQDLISATLGGAARLTVKSTGATGILTSVPMSELDVRDSAPTPTDNILQVANFNDSTRYFTISSTSTIIVGNVGIGNAAPASRLTVGSGTSTFEVDASGNIVKVNNVIYSWPSSQGAATTVLQNNGSGALSWAASAGLVNLNQAYNNATSSNELYVNSTQGALTIADQVTGGDGKGIGIGNLFEVQDRVNTTGDYSARYFTISSTATAIGNASSTYIVTPNARFAGNLTPSADATYTLGDPALRWKDLWLSGGSAKIAYDTSGTSVLRLGFETAQGYRGLISTPAGTPLQLRANLSPDITNGLTIDGSGNVSYGLRFSAPVHANNTGLKLPTFAGAPSAVTGTAEGDIVWNSTSDHLYVYNGASFTQIDSAASTTNLNQAYLNATGSPEIAITPSVGGVTIADTFSGTANIFEVTDRTNATGDYSQRYFTVSSTSTNYSYNSVTTGTASTLTVNGLTSGNGLAVTTSGTTQTGSLLLLQTASTSAFSNGGVRFNFTGAHSNTGFQIDDVTTSGVAMRLNVNSITTSGSGLIITANGMTSTSGQALLITSSGAYTNANGMFAITASGATQGYVQRIDANSLTTGSALYVNSNAAYTGTGVFIVSANTTSGNTVWLNSGSLTTGSILSLASSSGAITGTTTSGSMISAVYNGSTVTGSYAGNLAYISYSGTYTTTSTTHSGSLLNVTRSITENGASTQTITGPLAKFTDSLTLTSGTVRHGASVVAITQNYVGATNTALSVISSASGGAGATIYSKFEPLVVAGYQASPVSNLFSVQNTTLADGIGYTKRYFTISSTSTLINPLNNVGTYLVGIGNAAPASRLTVGSATSTFEVDGSGNLVKINNVVYTWPSSQGAASTVLQNNGSGTLTWSTPSGGSLNQAYLAATGSPEIALTPSVGAVTIADTFSGTGNIFEIQDRTNTTGDYSQQYFSVSATSTLIGSLSSGYQTGIGTVRPSAALTVASSVETPTSNIFEVQNRSLANGNYTAKYFTVSSTSTLIGVDSLEFTDTINSSSLIFDGTAGGTIRTTGSNSSIAFLDANSTMYFNSLAQASFTDSGVYTTLGLNLYSIGSSSNRASGSNLLQLTDSGTPVAGSSMLLLNATSATAFTGIKILANALTTGTGIDLALNGLTTGKGISVTSTSTGLTTGSLLNLSSGTTGAVATNGIALITATGNYTSSASTTGLLSLVANSTTGGMVQSISADALTNGTALFVTAQNLTTGRAVYLSGGSNSSTMTTGSTLSVYGGFTHTGAESGSTLLVTARDNSTGSGVTSGINIQPIFGASGTSSITRTLNGLKIEAPTQDAGSGCNNPASQTCTYNAINIGTQSFISALNTTTYNVNGIVLTSGSLGPNAGGTENWKGISIVMPAMAPSGGSTVTATALQITGSATHNAGSTWYAMTTDSNAGNVGIGTTAPTGLLSVGSSNEFTVSSTGTVTLNIPLSSGNFALCHNSNGVSTNQMIIDCANAPAADYMEMYPAAAGLGMGDIVMPGTMVVSASNGDQVPQVVKTDAAYKSTIIGVISNPNDAGDFNSIGYNIPSSANPLPVALKGRVRVKVSVENGAIAVGDPITSSSVSGIGMKSTKPGMIVGQALEAWNGPGQGTILVFMGNGWHSGLAITTDGATSLFNDNFGFKSMGVSSASGTSFSSYALNFKSSTWDSASNSAVTRNISVLNEASAASNYQLSFRNNDNALLASLNQNGDLALAGSLTVNGGFDYAETFPAAPDLDAGDLVMVDPDNANGYGVKKSAGAYENSLIGVISTKPGFLTGKNGINLQPVALAGRVPVKVTTESGDIKPGDPITSSSMRGVGMKAVEAGRVIGIALEGWNANGVGTITVFVNPSWWNGPKAVTASSAGGELTVSGDSLIDFKNSVLSNVSAIVSTTGLWSVTSDGILTAQAVDAKTVQAENVVVVQSQANASVAEGAIQSGYNAIVVQNPLMKSNSKVFISFLGDPGGGYWIGEKGEGNFTLHLARPAATTLPFEYWILGVDDRRSGPPIGAATSTPLSDGSSSVPAGSGTTGSGTGTTETIILTGSAGSAPVSSTGTAENG